MICGTARLELGADPQHSGALLAEHLAGCADCRQFRAEMLALDERLVRAFAAPPPAAARRRAAPPLRRWSEWALAAGVALVSVALVGVWLLRPTDTLAREVVAHVQAEPDSWLAAQAVSAGSIAAALKDSGVALNLTSDRITYAQSCWFQGHYVPHFVVQTADGPATVMILRHQHVAKARTFREAGMAGVIVPAGQGSIAVLARGGMDGVGTLAQQMQREVRWLPEPGQP